MADGAVTEARSSFAAGDYRASHQAAVQALQSNADDVELLLLAGRAAIEIDAPDAVTHLQRATELAGDDARTWHALGEALATEGRTDEANAAFRRAVELDPDDQIAVTHLGHTSLAAGRDEEGMSYLAQAAEATPGASSAAISLVDMYRSFGQFQEALDQAQRLADAVPDDALSRLDVAELSLAVGRLDEAEAAFDMLREIDDIPGHEAYPLLGMLQVEIRRERWDHALEVAEQARAIDPHGLSTDVEAFLREQGGAGAPPDEDGAPATAPPSRAEIEAALEAALAEYRRMHADDRRASAGGILG